MDKNLSADDLERTENKKLRREIVAWVNSFCWHKKRRQRDVWNILYYQFERITGEHLPPEDRLDWLERNHLLGPLYRATKYVN